MKIVDIVHRGGNRFNFGRHVGSYGRHVDKTEEEILGRFWAIFSRQGDNSSSLFQ